MLVKKNKRRLKDKSYAIVFSCLLDPEAGDRIADHLKCWDESREPAHELAWEWVLRMPFCLLGQPTGRDLRVWEQEPGQSYCY